MFIERNIKDKKILIIVWVLQSVNLQIREFNHYDCLYQENFCKTARK